MIFQFKLNKSMSTMTIKTYKLRKTCMNNGHKNGKIYEIDKNKINGFKLSIQIRDNVLFHDVLTL